ERRLDRQEHPHDRGNRRRAAGEGRSRHGGRHGWHGRHGRDDVTLRARLREEKVMVESARKHGPFYDRYPVRLKLPAPSRDLRPDENGAERLEWSEFLTRFFPNRRRHDFAALAAYEAYRGTVEQRTAQQRPTTHRTLPSRRDDGS